MCSLKLALKMHLSIFGFLLCNLLAITNGLQSGSNSISDSSATTTTKTATTTTTIPQHDDGLEHDSRYISHQGEYSQVCS